MAPPGIKDVAAYAQVSVTTVSSVLNSPESVSAPTRERVRAAIAELGFVRNETARQLRLGRSKSLAYIVHNAGNPFFTDVARGIERVVNPAGLSVFLCSSSDDAGREHEYLELAREARMRGVLITPVDPDNHILRTLPAIGIPVILVDRAATPAGSACSVAVDDVYGADLAVTHLLELGHRSIAFVGGPPKRVEARYEGALRAVSRAGASRDVLTVLETSALTVDEGRRAGERLRGLPRQDRPTAAFCCNDIVALGLLQEMTRQGIDVPGELSIVGYDDIQFAAAATVPLTSVRQPGELLGHTAAQMLLAEDRAVDPAAMTRRRRSAADAAPPHRHEQTVFRPELIVRASTAAPARA
jgi:LacI family transcriptional regulator